MSEHRFRVGQKVAIAGKDIRGEIAYIGLTSFGVPGFQWAGVILTEPKGKNNGTVESRSYFTCPDNYGMFVKPANLVLLDESGNPVKTGSDEKPRTSRLSSASSLRSVTSTSTRPTTVRRKSPIKAPQIKKQENHVTPSNSSSRLSLAGSRQSLSGSRTQLTTSSERSTPLSQSVSDIPKKTNERRTTISPPEMASTLSKTESFVETGFVETLKPQFTPGQSMASPALTAQHSVEEKLSVLQLQQENDDLRNQLRDVSEKLETLKQRRAEDKERFREFDKMQTQFEQMQEFKSRIMEAQTSLQRELQRSRQETKDAIEARDQHIEEMSELAENVEMITLDKEMAEEKADTLQLELDAMRERVEELTLDLEIIKNEMQNKVIGGGIVDANVSADMTKLAGSGAGITSYEFKQMEQQNTRLRETLVRLRDISAQDKHEIQKLAKEMETKNSEVNELHRTKEKLSAKIDELEAQLIDLHEQVDAALGADEMVEQLAEKKMELEDKVKLLEEEIGELEALEQVHEELVESNHELEMDLREELDMAKAAKREMLREKDAAFETILDRDQTILKFRELVHKLNEQIVEFRDRAVSSTQPSDSGKVANANNLVEAIDFKQMFAESKAYTRAIDLELRKIKLSQANEHVRLLQSFMPDTFMNRGGDHDAILVNLLVSRIIFKADIIIGQARERFPVVTTIDRISISQEHAAQQFAFRSRLMYHVHNLKAVMHQFLFGLNACTTESLLKAGSSLPEMQAQEKVIDGVVEMLKANQLDENSSTDHLEKAVAFFNAMFSVLLGADVALLNETQLVRDCVSSIQSACDSIYTDAAMMQAVIKGGDETSESGLLLQYGLQNADSVRQQLKLVVRRLPQDSTIVKCGLSQKTIQTLRQTNEHLGKAMTALFIASKLVMQSIVATATETTEDIASVTVTNSKIMDLLAVSCEKVYEQDDRGPAQNLKTVLATANTDMAQLAQYLLDNEYEIMSVSATAAAAAAKKELVPPIAQRAQFVKKQMEETKALKATVENREAEIRQLKLAAKVKQQELSEMQIRKDLAEKKVSVLQQDHEMNTKKLQHEYEEVAERLRKKEKEFEEGMNHLQKDIDTLELEKRDLRENLKVHGGPKKGDVKQSTNYETLPSSPYATQELQLLKKALTDERAERIKLQAAEMEKTFARFAPIDLPKTKDNRLNELRKNLTKVKHDYIMSLARGAQFPQANTASANVSKLLHDQRNKQRQIREEIKMRVEHLTTDIVNEYLQRKPHRVAKGDFAKFPTVELTRALRTKTP